MTMEPYYRDHGVQGPFRSTSLVNGYVVLHFKLFIFVNVLVLRH